MYFFIVLPLFCNCLFSCNYFYPFVYLWCVVYMHVSVCVVCVSACTGGGQRWTSGVFLSCFSILLCVCLHECCSMSMHMYAQTHREARCRCQLSSSVAVHLTFRQSLSLSLELSVFARVTGQGISGICLSSPPYSQVLRFILSSEPSCEHGYWVT